MDLSQSRQSTNIEDARGAPSIAALASAPEARAALLSDEQLANVAKFNRRVGFALGALVGWLAARALSRRTR